MLGGGCLEPQKWLSMPLHVIMINCGPSAAGATAIEMIFMSLAAVLEGRIPHQTFFFLILRHTAVYAPLRAVYIYLYPFGHTSITHTALYSFINFIK